MAKFDIKTVKPKFVVTTSPENKIDVVVNKPIIETKLSKSFFKLKNTGGPAGPRGEQGERGEQGLPGEPGPQGLPGRDGESATIEVASTTTLPASSSATVENVGTDSAARLAFGIPKGDKGEKGDPGAGLVITGSVATYSELPTNLTPADAGKAYFVQADGKLYVWSGESFPADGEGSQFEGPKGDTGATGPQGPQGATGPAGADGYSPTATVAQTSSGATISITDKDGTTTANVTNGTDGQDGQPGADGFSPIATVTQQGLNADISITDKNGTTTATVPGFGAQVVTSLPATGSENIIYLEREGQTASGKFIHITDSAPDSPLDYFNLYGETTQNGTPTPSAPVAVQTVTGENTLRITGKNLVDGSDSAITQKQRVSSAVSGNGFTLTSTSSSGACYATVPIPNSSALLGKTAKVSFSASGSGINTNIYYINSVGQAVSPAGTYTSGVIAFPDSLNGYSGFGIIFYTSNDGSATYEDIQLELGSTATAYEPYQNQSYEINLGKNLVRQIQDYSSDGLIFSTKQDGTTHIQGTSTSQVVNDTDISDIALSPGTYTFSYSYNGTQPPVNSGAIQLRKYDSGTETGTTIVALNAWANSSTTFTLTEMTKLQRLRIFFNSGQSINCDVSVQLEKGATASSFAAYFMPIELCKIGTYQDYIYKSGSKWYIHKAIRCQDYTGADGENWVAVNNRIELRNGDNMNGSSTNNPVICNYFQAKWGGEDSIFCSGADNKVCIIDTDDFGSNLTTFKTWIATHPLKIAYALATPTDTEITNAVLVSQLNNMLNNAVTYDRITNIYTNTENEQGTLGIGYYNAFGSYLYIGGQWYKFSRLTYGE